MAYVKMCPKCKSLDVEEDKSAAQSMGMFPTRYICNACRHSSYVLPEIKVNESSTTNHPDTSDADRTSAPAKTKRSKMHTTLKITGVIAIMFGVFALLTIADKWIGVLVLIVGILVTYYSASR